MPNNLSKIHLIKLKFKRADGALSGDFNILDKGNLPIATHKNIGFWTPKTREKLGELIKLMEDDIAKNVFEGASSFTDMENNLDTPVIMPTDKAHVEWEVEQDIAEQF